MKLLDLKKDFPFYKKNPETIWMDSGLTTLKPQFVVDKMSEVLSDTFPTIGGSATPLMSKNYKLLDEATKLQAKLINANIEDIFYGPVASITINMMAQMIMKTLNEGDKIILGKLEHGSNYLPWKTLAEAKGVEILHYELTDKMVIDLEHLKSMIDDKVKVIAIAHIFNTIATTNDIKTVKEISPNAFVFIDAIQSVGKIPVDVKDLGVDALIYTGHKIFGPTGISVVYLNPVWKNKLQPVFLGGKMHKKFDSKNIVFLESNEKFSTGSPNLASIVAFGEAVRYILNIEIENIKDHIINISNYAKEKLSELENITLYNAGVETANVIFSVKGALGEDVSYMLAVKNNIYLRSGQQCTSLENPIFKGTRAVRASFHLYNNIEEVDALVEAIKQHGDFSEAQFLPREERKCL